MSSLDGEHAWRDLHNRLSKDVKADFFRFNVRFHGKEPAIDDVACMDALAQTVNDDLTTAPRLNDIVVALVISSFFFELDRSMTTVHTAAEEQYVVV